jgi:calcineurin-like phosphoesterase family protein
MRDIFIISDTHFGHENILTFKDDDGNPVRTFADADEMDALMIENWNKTVKDNDIIYHLGDVYFGKGHQVLPFLKGRKRLVLGNHDNPKSEHLIKNFQKIMLLRWFPEFDCVLTHIPIHESGMFKVYYNVHGHIHQKKSPSERYINCSVEVINYTPMAIEEVMRGKPNYD